MRNTLSMIALTLATSLALVTPASSAENFLTESTFSAKVRGIHFDRDFENDAKDREQSALGLELNYTSGYLGDIVGVDISGYHLQELSSSGAVANDILGKDNNGDIDNAVSKIGQAYLKLNIADTVKAKVGRQKVKTMLLASSGSRAIPSSFEGVSVNATVANVELYGVRVDQWSARHDDHFEGFRTDVSAEDAIDYISVLGIKYKKGALSAQLEQLNSKDYLKKLGLIVGYQFDLEKSQLNLQGGYFTSQDAGGLFVAGAEKGYLDGNTSDNNAKAYYVDLDWRRNNLSLGMALTAIRDDVWIEDNFAGDHGTNPFPTRASIGNDLTGKNEDVWQLRVGYNWNQWIQGLTTKLNYTYGNDAENTVDKSLGQADEWYTELDVKWKLPVIKGLSLRWIAHDYRSDKTGTVAQVKGDDFDHRVYLDYHFLF